MLDSRRDRRYRSGAHRRVGVGLREVTFHGMLGTSPGVPGFPSPIRPTPWKGGFPEVRMQDRARPGPMGPETPDGLGSPHRVSTT